MVDPLLLLFHSPFFVRWLRYRRLVVIVFYLSNHLLMYSINLLMQLPTTLAATDKINSIRCCILQSPLSVAGLVV